MAATRSGEISTRPYQLGRAARSAVAVAALVSAASCTGESPAPTPTPAPAQHASSVPGRHTPRPSATTPSSEALCRLPDASFAVTKRYSGSVALSPLVGKTVRLGAHDCYDSFVIELDGQAAPNDLPGIDAHYIEGPVKAEPSDQIVSLRGKAFLQVTVGASMYATGGGSGPKRVSSAAVPGIDEAMLTENNEGQSTWTFGLDTKRPFTVDDIAGTASCPTECIAIDIQANPTVN